MIITEEIRMWRFCKNKDIDIILKSLLVLLFFYLWGYTVAEEKYKKTGGKMKTIEKMNNFEKGYVTGILLAFTSNLELKLDKTEREDYKEAIEQHIGITKIITRKLLTYEVE